MPVKKWYSGIPFLTVPIQTRRRRLLNDEEFVNACMAAYYTQQEPIPITFDRFMKFIVWKGNSRKLNRQIQSKTGRELIRSAYIARTLGESFEVWLKSMLLVLLLAACSKPEPPATVCTIFPGTSTVHPIFKYPIRSDVLSVRVKFTASCLYAPLRAGCAGDWNKLIYFGDFNPHNSGAAFVWMPENDSIKLGWYCWLDGVAPAKSGRMGSLLTVPVDEWVMLQISLKSGVMWTINGVMAKAIPDRINGRWVSQGWFGGADNEGCDCNAVEKINYLIEIQ